MIALLNTRCYLHHLVMLWYLVDVVRGTLLPPSALSPATAEVDDAAAAGSVFPLGTPVIGILSQPRFHPLTNSTMYHYIASSYVKWVESGGARSVPIPFDAPDEMVDDLFGQINAVLFPGGPTGPPPRSAKRIWQLAEAANRRGDFMPVWGTCLGFEYMLMLASEEGESILQSGFEAENISLPLIFPTAPTGGALHSSLRGQRMPAAAISELYSDPVLRHTAQNKAVAMNSHTMGIEPDRFQNDAGLTSMFHVTTTNVDKGNKFGQKRRPFVSTIETRQPDQYPYYGVQYHPEKNPFEYAMYPGTNVPYLAINHSPDAVMFSFELARFFVGKARENLRRGRHSLTKPAVFKPVVMYQTHKELPFEEVYVIPSAAEKQAAAIEEENDYSEQK